MEADGALTFSQGFFLDKEGGEECEFNFWLSHRLLSSSGFLEGSQIIGVMGANDACKRTL